MRRKRIGWLPIIEIVIVGLYLKSATQAPPVATNNNNRPETEPVPQHADHTLYLKIVGVHDGDTMGYGLVANSSAGDSLRKCR